MGGPTSGRRGAPRNEDGSFANGSSGEVSTSTAAPELDGTPEANQRFCAWVAREGAMGNLEPRLCDALIGSARAEQGAVRLKHGLNEIAELRDLVDGMKKAVASRVRQEQQDRFSATSPGTTTTIGRVRVKSPDGGEPH